MATRPQSINLQACNATAPLKSSGTSAAFDNSFGRARDAFGSRTAPVPNCRWIAEYNTLLFGALMTELLLNHVELFNESVKIPLVDDVWELVTHSGVDDSVDLARSKGRVVSGRGCVEGKIIEGVVEESLCHWHLLWSWLCLW
jgi:hypothetical protein